MADEDWRLLLDQYPPPADRQGNPDADELPEDDAPWRRALRDAALRTRSGVPASSPDSDSASHERRVRRADRRPAPPSNPLAPADGQREQPADDAAPCRGNSVQAGKGHGENGRQPARPARAGDRVLITSLADTPGTVIALGNDEALVETQAARVRVALDELRVVEQGVALRGRPSRPAATIHLAADLATHRLLLTAREGRKRTRWPAIDLHGLALPDALERLDDFLYACWDEGCATVAVIHGKGSGTLRTAVQALLTGHPAVHHARPALHNAGGEGVTIVTLYTS